MKSRTEEIEELIDNNKVWDWIGDSVDWDSDAMKEYCKRLMQIVKLEVEYCRLSGKLYSI